MPADLLESTLFGHVKGAFTSAIASKKGLFEVADGGTLFLDEIGTMSMETQAKILRVLQDRKFMHLGGVSEIQVDVRIIAATNVDLAAAGEGRQVPRRPVLPPERHHHRSAAAAPAQERHPAAGASISSRSSAEENERPLLRMTPEALRPLLDYNWPGNVRELENVIERAVVLANGPNLTIDLLPDNVVGRGTKLAIDGDIVPTLRCSRSWKTASGASSSTCWRKCGWNQTEAADRFRIPLSTLNQKIKRLNIEIKKKVRENGNGN